MPMAAGRRLGLALLFGLVAGVLLLGVLPGDPGAIRLAGVGALWWLAVVVAPLVATLAVSVLAPSSADGSPGLASAAVWAVPAVLVSVAARVLAGAAEAPIVVLAVLVAPLAALLVAPRTAQRAPNPVAAVAALAGAAGVLWASFSTLAAAAQILSARRWQAALVAGALALLASEWRPRARRGRPALGGLLLAVGATGFVGPVLVVGAVLGAPPWSAWGRAAARPAFTFVERGAWVGQGPLVEPRTFAFAEPHRVTALAPGAYRIIEQVGPRRITREWRLAAGDALTLRPGDLLVLEAGARVRFEAGKRVPGSPPSGAVWADPPERNSAGAAARALGVVLTLVGGAFVLALAPAPLGGWGARAAPALLLGLVLAAVSWGVYATLAAPELALGVRGRLGLFELPALVVPGAVGRGLAVTAMLALFVLSASGASALRGVVAGLGAGAPGGAVVWAATLVVAAAGASVWPGDAWQAFLAGCGLAASAAGAPRLARGGRVAELCGSLVGGVAFVLLWADGVWLPAWAAAAGAYPALVAAPLGFVVVRAEAVLGPRRAVR